LLRNYLAGRRPGESLRDFFRRHGKEELRSFLTSRCEESVLS
jgi:hypothetical protein